MVPPNVVVDGNIYIFGKISPKGDTFGADVTFGF